MNKVIAGIDIGSNGNMVIYANNNYVSVKPEQYANMFRSLVLAKDKPEIIVYIEKLHAFPGMSSTTVWKMAENQGIVIGILKALEIHSVFVTAREWQKDLNMPKGEEYKQRKLNLIKKAKELFPNQPIFNYSADSWLICRFAIQKEKRL